MQLCKASSTLEKSINVTHNTSRQKKEKIHMIICRKTLDENQNSFMIKTPNKLGLETNFFNLIMDKYKTLPAYLTIKKLDIVP